MKGRQHAQTGRVLFVPPEAIRSGPAQPRRVFDQTGLQELADSIGRHGVLQPLTVRRRDDGFELVAGERRLRAARMAGLGEVPCILLAQEDAADGSVALIERLRRKDLDFIDEAEGLSRLMQQYGLSQEQAAARVGKSQPAVANKLRILRLGPQVLELLRAHHLTERHARALLRLETESQRLAALEEIIRRQFNVAGTEQYIETLLEGHAAAQPDRQQDVGQFFKALSRSLTQIRRTGIAAEYGKEESEREIVLTIRIPKQAG